MDRARSLDVVERSVIRIADIAVESPHAEVPRYPGSDVAALVRHVITIHEWVAGMVSALAQEPAPQNPPDDTLAGTDLLARYDRGWRRLVRVLADADEAAPMWTFGSDRTAAFWVRRMAHETAIHAWDASSAVSEHPDPIPLDVAVTGLAEGLRIHVQRPLRRTEIGGSEETIGIECADVDAGWTITLREVGIAVDDGVTDPDAQLTGRASDLWLAIGGRVPSDPLERSGDAAVLERLESALTTIRAAM